MINVKKIIIVVILIIFFVLIFPNKLTFKDGGSICYKSLTYEITNYNTLGGLRGKTVEIFGIRVYDGTYDINIPIQK